MRGPIGLLTVVKLVTEISTRDGITRVATARCVVVDDYAGFSDIPPAFLTDPIANLASFFEGTARYLTRLSQQYLFYIPPEALRLPAVVPEQSHPDMRVLWVHLICGRESKITDAGNYCANPL
jgi:hypothetical protein